MWNLLHLPPEERDAILEKDPRWVREGSGCWLLIGEETDEEHNAFQELISGGPRGVAAPNPRPSEKDENSN